MGKIKYPRTTLEVCDVTLDVLRRGVRVGFLYNYPEIDCYNGRKWQDGMSKYTIYYVRSSFQAYFLDLDRSKGAEGFDVRMAMVRISNDSMNNGFPFFWSCVWYKTGRVRFSSKPPEEYHPEIYREYYTCTRWNDSKQDKVSEFDPKFLFPNLALLHGEIPPHPIQF